MTDKDTEMRTVVVERDFAHPPEKVWRALTQPHLIAEWLVQNDFLPEVGHRFSARFDWGAVDCRVLEIEPPTILSYTWTSGELDSTVTWYLSATETGTRLRMEQTGFGRDKGQARFYHGARAGWPRFLDAMEALLTRLEAQPPI